MPEIEIRPALKTDLDALLSFETHYETSHVWQMDSTNDESQVSASFRLARLPRTVKQDYPRPPALLTSSWLESGIVLAAYHQDKPVGYVRISENIAPGVIWITDLVVKETMRRKGIAKALVLAIEEWGVRRKVKSVSLEMQSKNFPAIQLAKKLGFEFCGYLDHYYPNDDIAIIFTRFVR